MSPQAGRQLRLGVAGLGRAFTLMLPTFVRDPRIKLVAAADPRADARGRFAAEFDAKTYVSVPELCSDPAVDVVYVATPHQLHAEHMCMAAARGKHVLVEKPMATSLAECRTMIEAARAAKVMLIVGHSHSFDAPIRRTCDIIASGAIGKARMITALNFTDFLYRPRRPEELIIESGGGVLFSQAAHQVDIVRLLGGGKVRTVRASAGAWEVARSTEGAYTAHLAFENGVFASLTYSGYAHFDSDEFCGWIGELGQQKEAAGHGAARRLLQNFTADEETSLKAARNYGGADYATKSNASSAPLHQHFGFVLVSCDRADLRPLPMGVMVYGDEEQRLEAISPPAVPRAEVIDELYDAIVFARPPVHSGEWGMATLEICLAILQSSRKQREITLQHQVAVPVRPAEQSGLTA